MTEAGGFALGRFLAQWRPRTRYDLSASECAPLTLPALLTMAEAADRRRWEQLELGYTDPAGAAWLRDAIAARHDGMDADDVLCCAGAQEALTCIAQTLLAPDDHAILAVPIYQPTEWTLMARCRVTGVALTLDGPAPLDLQRVADAIRPETKLLLVNFPNSPTGATIDANGLADLIALCRRHGIWLVNDEVYRRTDGDPAGPPRVADLYERGISVDAMSKGFGLPGLRIGWMVCRDRLLLAQASRVKSLLSGCASAPGEVLAHIALQAEPRIVGRNRAVGLARLRRLRALLDGCTGLFEMPAGDTLAFASPRYLGADGASAFAARLAREAGVLVLPSSLWPSALAPVAQDRLRIGLGGEAVDDGIEAMRALLAAHRSRADVDLADQPIA